jgi:RNase P/RNase MRP subunit p30
MDYKFFDLNVVFSENWREIIKRSKILQLAGICLVVNSKGNLEKYHRKVEEIKKETSLEIIKGLMIDENKDNIIKIAKEYRRKFDLILVKGGDYEVNRITCGSTYVDILSTPGKGRRDCGIDHICCKDARENDLLIELNFKELLTAQGMDRIHELNKMKEIIRLCKIFGTNFIVNSGAKSKCELRGGRELASLSYSLGASLEEALFVNTELPYKLIQENKNRTSQPLKGVHLDEYER